MKKYRHFVLIAILAIVFLSYGCVGKQPKPPVVAAEPAKPERHRSIHPNAFYYEGILDIAILMQGDWGEPIWRNDAYMPAMIEIYYKNPKIGGEPQYACINGMRHGIIGYSYMIGDIVYTFKYNQPEAAYVRFEPTPDVYKQYIDDYAKAVSHYRSKGT